MRCLVWPISLLITFAAGWAYYKVTHQFNVVWLIGLCGPYLFSWLIKFAVKRWFNPDQNPPGIFSRLCGIALNLTWATVFVFLVVAVLAVFPFGRFDLKKFENDVHQSITFKLVKPVLVSRGILPADASPALCMEDVCKVDASTAKALSDDEEVQAIINDPRIRKMMSDPKIMAAFQSRDIGAILSNPVLSDLRNDPAFLLKAIKVYPKMQKVLNDRQLGITIK